MPASSSSFSRLRFGFAPVPPVPHVPRVNRGDRGDRVDRATATAHPSQLSRNVLEMPRDEGLDLLDWLGLGRPDFGAIPARELAPRCRRRLWSVKRNAHPSLRARTGELLAIAEAAGDGVVLFG